MADRIERGQRLSRSDFLQLARHPRVLELGAWADRRNAQRNGGVVWFLQHRLLTVGTIDVMGEDANLGDSPSGSPIVGASRRPDRAESLMQRIADEDFDGISELRLGTFQPEHLPFAELLDILAALADRFPDKRLRALSARQLWLYSRYEGTGIEALARALVDQGSVYLDGRGAGLLGTEMGHRSDGFNPELWFMIHRLCHLNGLQSDASMEYGLLDSPEQRLGHLERLRAIQDDTQGFLSFMPLAHQYQQPATGYYQKTSGIDDLRMVALSRLYLDNIPQQHVLWGRVGFDIAQLALSFGANSVEGEITATSRRGRTFRSLSRREAKAFITKAERIPLERDGVYRPVAIPDPASVDTPSLLNEDNILYKLDNRLDVEMPTYLAAAESVSLLRLGLLASDFQGAERGAGQMVRHLSMAAPSYSLYTPSLADPLSCATEIVASLPTEGPTPPMVSVDFGGWKQLDGVTLDGVMRCLNQVKTAVPTVQIAWRGMRGLWQLAAPEELAAASASLGVTVVESSVKESEEDFTRSERLDFHRDFHRQGIATVPLVRLAAPFAGGGQPFWEDYCQDLLAWRNLHRETGLVKGIKVLQAPNAFVTPYEYLRAVALARIIGHELREIITPFDEIPTINQARARVAHAKKREALKMLPMCALFGASDIGEPNPLSRNASFVWEELLHAGITPFHRDYAFEPTV